MTPRGAWSDVVPYFAYIARDATGRAQSGTSEAASAGLVVNSLRQRGWLVLDVRPSRANTTDSINAMLRRLTPSQWAPPRGVDVELSLHQLAVMLRSGLTLLTALRTVAEQSSRLSLKRIWLDIADRIQEGAGLAEAMRAHKCFPSIAIQLVRVGEQTGMLESVLTRAAETLEARRRTRASVITALIYPTIVILAAVAVIVVLVVWIIPRVQRSLESLGRDLPAMTQALIDVSTFLRTWAVEGVIGGVFLYGACTAFYMWDPGRFIVHRYVLRVPMIGSLFSVSATATLARNLSTLLRSGITLLEALRTVEQQQRNVFLAKILSDARTSVMQGGTFAEPLKVEGGFTPMLARMVAVGESAGTLDDILDEVARFHEMLLAATVRRLGAIVEPVIIVVVGGIVGLVYVSFFLALFSAAGG